MKINTEIFSFSFGEARLTVIEERDGTVRGLLELLIQEGEIQAPSRNCPTNLMEYMATLGGVNPIRPSAPVFQRLVLEGRNLEELRQSLTMLIECFSDMRGELHRRELSFSASNVGVA
jgi:hypothetical protein